MPKKAVQLILACHPGPSAVVTIVALMLCVALGYAPGRLALVGGAVLFGQLSIGFSNDWFDSARDAAVHRSDKPIARGSISRATVRTAAFVSLALTIALSILLGPAAAAAQLAGVAAGWLYNAGVKATLLSVVPYIVCFGLLPAVATYGQQQPAPPAIWVLAVGALLGIAAHFTNVLPDLADDRATGIRGLPHVLGARASGIIAFVALAIGAILLTVGPGTPPSAVAWLGLTVTLAIAVLGCALVLRRHTSRVLMRLVMAAAIVEVVLLALSGQSMLA